MEVFYEDFSPKKEYFQRFNGFSFPANIFAHTLGIK